MDSNALAFIGKYVGYDSEEYQLSRYYITGAFENFVVRETTVDTSQEFQLGMSCISPCRSR